MSALPRPTTPPRLDPFLQAYHLGEVLRVWPASHGIENENYFVETQGNNRIHGYVLTIMSAASYAGDAYVPMMRSLEGHGLPVAPPLDNRMGEPITEIEGQACLLQPRLKGQHTINPTLKQIEGLARFIGQMHRVSAAPEFKLPSYPRTQNWLAREAASISAQLPFNDQQLLEQGVTQVTSLLSRDDVQQLPLGLIHGDLFRDNVLFNEWGLTGVLDFHHTATGYWIYDLAVAANDWCSDASGRLDPDRTTRLLRAYHQVRPLAEAEVWFFSMFLSYAALAFWISREAKTQSTEQGANQRRKDPQEFKRIFTHLQKRQFYLDYRGLL